jgi:hypothetical protein
VGLKTALRWLAALCASFILSACATGPAATATAADIEKAAGVGPSELIFYAPGTFASANGGRMTVEFLAGVFAQTQDRIHLLSYDRITKSFRRDITFETAALPGVALVSGPLGYKQLQIQTESGVVVCEIGGMLNGGRAVSQVYDRLLAAGARTFESPGWVSPIVQPTPVVIPIYIPAGR